MAATTSSTAAASLDHPVAVVGQQFCLPYPVELTVKKKVLSLTGGDFTVTDGNGKVLFKVQGKLFSLQQRCVLLNAAGHPIVSMQAKIVSMHRRWQAFQGESSHPKDLMFSVKMSSLFQFKTMLNVYLPQNIREEVCDFKIRGNYFQRSCTIYLGDSNVIIGQIKPQITVQNLIMGKDTFGVTICPNVDYAFVAALVVILDEMHKKKN